MPFPENFNELKLNLNKTISGCVAEYHDVLPSTQVRGKELAAAGAEKVLVVAGEQTAGRGRMAGSGRIARRWESPKGSGLYFSVLSRPSLPAESFHMINIAAALSVADAVKYVLGIELQLKWPNDLLVSSAAGYRKARKVCGILSESALRGGATACVTGIGLNLYAPAHLPEDLKDRMGWLSENGEEINCVKLLSRAVENFFKWIDEMEREGIGPILSAYRDKCASVGRVVKVETGSETLTGLCSGIGDGGELLLETQEGTRGFHAADVTHATLEAHR